MLSPKTGLEQEQKLQLDRAGKPAALLSCIEASYCTDFFDAQNGSTEVEFFDQFAIKPCKCESQWCPDCRLAHCVRWRERLRPVVETWESARMLTLTIDRKKWNGPVEAYETIQAKRSVSKFVEKLSRKRVDMVQNRDFFYVIEFHPSSPEWVHWHLAVRPKSGWLNKGQRGWNLQQDHLAKIWGHGFVRASDAHETSDPTHAMHYLTKYIAKQNVEAPDWVMNREGNFRKFSTSRGLCSEPKPKPEKKTERENEKNTPAQRIAKCRNESKVFKVKHCEVRTIGKTEKRRSIKSVGKLSVPFDELQQHPEAVKAALVGDLCKAAKIIDPTCAS